MGRASNRKKAQRQAGSSTRRASQSSPVDALSPQRRRQLAGVLQTLFEEAEDREEHEASARRTWCGGAEPVPAEAPRWPENSLGDRFFASTHLEEARHAPSLLTAKTVGEDKLTEVRLVLLPVLADAVPNLESEVVADALISAFATEYRCELPGDAELLDRIGHPGGDALERLAAAGAVPPSDVLPVGLAILSALAQLCRSGSASVLQLTA